MKHELKPIHMFVFIVALVILILSSSLVFDKITGKALHKIIRTCAKGGEGCSGGGSTCTSTCSPRGNQLCFGDSLKTCGDYNDNGCLEWGNVVECDYGCDSTVLECGKSFRVFVTSDTSKGNFGGVEEADTICQNFAESVDLGGTWKAWISDSTSSVADRLHKSSIPYSLLNNDIVADNWDDLVDGSLRNPISLDENGYVVSGDVGVWTGTDDSGESLFDNCNQWLDDASDLMGMYGRTDSIDESWTYRDTAVVDPSLFCNSLNRLYCFEQPTCGNGIIEDGEECEDGNDDITDGCVECLLDDDEDGLSNRDELLVYFTDPELEDSDADRLTDREEIFVYNTDPTHSDSDWDYLDDGFEVSGDYCVEPCGSECKVCVTSGPGLLTKTKWKFTFDYQGDQHTRTQSKLSVTDTTTTTTGTLETMPWMELIDPEMKDEFGRSYTTFEIAQRSIPDWADAGATKIGFVGSYYWMKDDDTEAEGYQNQYIDQLVQIGDENNIEIVFGIKFGSVISNWSGFFDYSPENGFKQIGDLMSDVTEYTGTTDWIFEGEARFSHPAENQTIPYAYNNNLLDLTPGDRANFEANMEFLKVPGIQVHWWTPFFFVNSAGEPYPEPEVRTPGNSKKYTGTELFKVIHNVLGDKFSQIKGAFYYTYAPGRQSLPIHETSTSLKEFKALQDRGAYNYEFITYIYRPNMIDVRPGSYQVRGPSELLTGLSYFFGRDIDNSDFPDLPFKSVQPYSHLHTFDLVAKSMNEYVNNGLHFSRYPRDSMLDNFLPEGEALSISVSVDEDKTSVSDIGVSYYSGCEPDMAGCEPVSLEPDFTEIIVEGNKAHWIWVPGGDRGDSEEGVGYYWVNFEISGSGGYYTEYPMQVVIGDTVS